MTHETRAEYWGNAGVALGRTQAERGLCWDRMLDHVKRDKGRWTIQAFPGGLEYLRCSRLPLIRLNAGYGAETHYLSRPETAAIVRAFRLSIAKAANQGGKGDSV